MLDVRRIDEAQAGPPPEPDNFVGRVRMQNIAAGTGAGGLEYLAVHFAGAHTKPHTHTTDQVLCFVRGTGFVWIAGGGKAVG